MCISKLHGYYRRNKKQFPPADIIITDPPFTMLTDKNGNLLPYDDPVIKEFEHKLGVLATAHSKEDCTMLICHKFYDGQRWYEILRNLGWEVQKVPIVCRPQRVFIGGHRGESTTGQKEAHTYWTLAWRGKRYVNEKAKDEGVWSEGYEGSNSIDYIANQGTWHGPTRNKMRFRKPEKSEDQMRKLLGLLISKYKLKWSDKFYIYDYCCGTGTTGVIANEFYAHFVGNDRDPEAVDITFDRLKKHYKE